MTASWTCAIAWTDSLSFGHMYSDNIVGNLSPSSSKEVILLRVAPAVGSDRPLQKTGSRQKQSSRERQHSWNYVSISSKMSGPTRTRQKAGQDKRGTRQSMERKERRRKSGMFNKDMSMRQSERVNRWPPRGSTALRGLEQIDVAF